MSSAALKTNHLADAQVEFVRTVGEDWECFKRSLGEFLAKYQAKMSPPMFHQLKKWISTKHRISISQQTVSLRLVKGEIDERLLRYIPAATLAATSADCMPNPDTTYHIYSPDAGAPVRKKLSEMSRTELSACVTNRGISTVNAPLKLSMPNPREIAMAKFVRVENNNVIAMMGDLEIHIKITEELKKLVLE